MPGSSSTNSRAARVTNANGRGTCAVCKERYGIKLDGKIRSHRVKSDNVTERVQCKGSNLKPAPVENIKDGLTKPLRDALDGIPGGNGWFGYEESRKVYVELGGCLLNLGLSDEDAAKILEAAFWAAIRCYGSGYVSRR